MNTEVTECCSCGATLTITLGPEPEYLGPRERAKRQRDELVRSFRDEHRKCRERLAELEGALQPFAAIYADVLDNHRDPETGELERDVLPGDDEGLDPLLRYGDFRRAHEAASRPIGEGS